jgi:hypothetical protein
VCESRDDKGHVVLYDYQPEDSAGADLTQTCERNGGDRDGPRRTVEHYLSQVRVAWQPIL